MKANADLGYQDLSLSAPSFSVAPSPSSGAVGCRPLSTLWEAAANGLMVLRSLNVIRNCLHTSSPGWLGRQRSQVKGGADSWDSWQWHKALIQAGSVLNVPLRLHSLTCSCPFPADTGNCPAQVVLIQEYGAGVLTWVCETLLGFSIKKKKKKLLWAVLRWFHRSGLASVTAGMWHQGGTARLELDALLPPSTTSGWQGRPPACPHGRGEEQRWLVQSGSLPPQRVPGLTREQRGQGARQGTGPAPSRVKRTLQTSPLLTAPLLACSSFLVLFMPCGEHQLNAPFHP